MRHKLFSTIIAFSGCLLISSHGYTCNDLSRKPDDLFNLELQDLRNLLVTGAAVRNLGLQLLPATENPFQLINCHMPLSVEIIEKETIAARNLRTVVEAVENMTGVLSGESPAEPYSFSIRGFSRDSISVLYDGISMGRASINMRPQSTNNLERVEIIKGPVTLLHGQGAAGGTVNIITKKAKLTAEHSGNVVASYGSYDSLALSTDLSGPINNDAAYRLDASYRELGGWVDNSDSEYSNAGVSTFWALKPNLDLSFLIHYQEDDLPAYWGTPLVPVTAARDPNSDVVKTNDGLVIDEKTRFNNYNVYDHIIDSDSLWVKADINWEISEVFSLDSSLYSFSADRRWQNAESYIYDESVQQVIRDRLYVKHDRDLWGITSGLQINNTLAGKDNQLLLNLEYSENDFYRDIGFEPINFFVDSVNLQNPTQGEFGLVAIRPDSFLLKTSALVISDSLDLSHKLSLDLGVRFEKLDVNRESFDFDGSIIERKSIEKNFNQQSYRVGSNYNFSDQFSGYINHSKAHDPIDGDFSFSYDIQDFKPSDIKQTEIGFKLALNEQKAAVIFSIFDIDKTLPAQTFDKQIINNRQSSQGAELSLHASLSNDSRVGGSIAYVDAEFGNYYDPDAGLNVSGNKPVNAPKWMTNIWASINNIAGLPIELGGGISHVSSRFANSGNTVELKNYTLINIFSTYTHKSYRFALHVNNLTDEIYAPWSDVFYPSQVILGPPRRVEISLDKSF